MAFPTRSLLIKFFALAFALIVIFCMYLPGVTGGFMLDDLSSLPGLFKNIDTCGMACGVLSGSTGPTGRPLSLLTFALQQSQWPNPYYFKLINILIHLLNMVLALAIFILVLKKLGFQKRAFHLSLAASIIWAIWPLQVSSVLYVIQRMSLLSSTFVLVGIWVFLLYRPKLHADWERQLLKPLLFAFALGGVVVLGILSKESAVQLFLYIAILEHLLFASDGSNTKNVRLFRYLCLYLPLAVFWGYLLIKLVGSHVEQYATRDFTMRERVLTQGRVLLDYLQSLLFPKMSNLGLYHDGYLKSTSIFAPLSTLFSWLVIGGVCASAFINRKKYTLISLVVFWYFAGHVLEGSFWPLELYFEHRNYIPILFVSLVMVVGVNYAFDKASKKIVAQSLGVACSIYVIMLFTMTIMQTKLWGNELEYSIVQAKEHSDSKRARNLLVEAYGRVGMFDESYQEMLRMKADFPGSPGLILGSVEFACYDPKYELEPIEQVVEQLKRSQFGYAGIITIRRALESKLEGLCKGVSSDYLLKSLMAMKENEKFQKKKHLIENLELSVYLEQGKIENALSMFEHMYISEEQWSTYISLLATNQQFEKALEVSNHAISLLEGKMKHKYYYDDVLNLRSEILLELQN